MPFTNVQDKPFLISILYKLPRSERARYCPSSLHERAEHSRSSKVCIRPRTHPWPESPRFSASKYKVLSIKYLAKKNTEYKIHNTRYRKSSGFTLIAAVRLATLSQWRSSDIRRKAGFTLIEFLVVLGILALVVGSITLFLTSILKGTNQANVTAEVKQNGQAVLDSLERQIRGAVGAEAVDSNHLKIIREEAQPLHIKCLTRNANQNGRIGTAVEPVGSTVAPPDISYLSVSNDDPVSGVNIESSDCSFSVIPADFSSGANAPAVVSISFAAKQGFKAAQRADFQAQATFKTTISLRTYK